MRIFIDFERLARKQESFQQFGKVGKKIILKTYLDLKRLFLGKINKEN